MRKRLRIVLAFLFVAILGTTMWLVLRPHGRPEPVYLGKRLTSWLRAGYGSSPNNQAAADDADHAVRSLGTTALPFLAEMAGTKDSRFRASLIQLAEKQHFIKLNLMSAYQRRRLAARAIHVLRTNAESIIPTLAGQVNDGELAGTAASILADLGPTGIEPLTNAMTNTDWQVRVSVVLALGRYAKPSWRDVQPPKSKEEFELLNRTVVPVLLSSLKDRDYLVQASAGTSLGWFVNDPEIVVPALIGRLADVRLSVRANVADALGQFGTNANSAVPALLKALKDERSSDGSVSQALKKIDPEAAAKAGVK